MAAMNMNQEQFKQAIREEKPVLVDFWRPGAAIAGGSALRMRRLRGIRGQPCRQQDQY